MEKGRHGPKKKREKERSMAAFLSMASSIFVSIFGRRSKAAFLSSPLPKKKKKKLEAPPKRTQAGIRKKERGTKMYMSISLSQRRL